MRVMAIDYGERRVGLAISDPVYRFVSGLPTIDRKTLKTSLIEALGEIVGEQEVGKLLLGIPYNMDGSVGPAAEGALAFKAELEAGLGLPVEEWDERLTTEAARRALRDLGYSEREMKDKIDQLAAVLMLENFLRRESPEERTDDE